MRFLVIIQEDVYKELNEVFSYYEERQTDLGVKFLDDWEQAMDRLEERPFIYQVQKKQFRTIKLDRFPFLIVYKVEEGEIIIYKLIHCKKNPAKRYKK